MNLSESSLLAELNPKKKYLSIYGDLKARSSPRQRDCGFGFQTDKRRCEMVLALHSPVPGVLSVLAGAAAFVLGMVMPT